MCFSMRNPVSMCESGSANMHVLFLHTPIFHVWTWTLLSVCIHVCTCICVSMKIKKKKKKKIPIPLQIIRLQMEHHLCWVADMVWYIPVDLWAPRADINAITYAVGKLKQKNHSPCNVRDEHSALFFLSVFPPLSVIRLRNGRGQTS